MQQWQDMEPSLFAAIEDVLFAHPQGISEYQLLKHLQRQSQKGEQNTWSLSDPVSLFRSHFTLFHVLYRLKEVWQSQSIGDLDIHTLNIKARPWSDKHTCGALKAVDPVAEYYLNWQNAIDTNESDVNSLLERFWRDYLHVEPSKDVKQHWGNETLTESYRLLNLPYGAALKAVKRQYLKLIHQHHPDKGGDKQEAQALQTAYASICASQRIKKP